MDVIHEFLNVVFPVLSIVLFIFFIPVLLLFNLLRFCYKSVYPEKLVGKVILITGASAGIGECLAMEYAKEGARLALVARREEQLRTVAEKAKLMGSPDVIIISADVSKVEDCKRFVDETISHFGKLDYLVNNAAVATFGFFEGQTCVPSHAPVMDINFWGSVYTTHSALPHLRKSKGRIIAICSCGSWFGSPRVSIYNASKAAMLSFFETLKIELGSDISITIVTPGLVKSRLTKDEWVEEGNAKWVPMISTERCARSIVESTKRGDKYFTDPTWMKTMLLWKMFCPDILNLITIFAFVSWPKNYSKKPMSHNLHSVLPFEFKSK